MYLIIENDVTHIELRNVLENNVANKAPVLLFVYNRPKHTRKVLDGLLMNIESVETDLYVFCDGPKINASEFEIEKIYQTQDLIRKEARFNSIKIFYNYHNKGLANSIIDGVSEVLMKHNRVIVLEDDIVPEKGFLKYMNEALTMYENTPEIGCIHAWNYTFNKNLIKQSTFLLRGADCWGWGTWKRAWDLFESNGSLLLNEIQINNLEHEFDRNNTHAYTKMLKDQIEGKNNSWAIRWHASLFLHNKYCLHPSLPIVKNIGLDGSGTHCNDEEILQITTKKIKLTRLIDIKESEEFYQSYNLGIKTKLTRWERLIKLLH